MRKWLFAGMLLGGMALSTEQLSAQQLSPRLMSTTSFRYSAGPLSNMAASPTDWVVINASTTTKAVTITTISVCGTAPAPATVWVSFIKRSSSDTGGTSTSTSAANVSGTTVTATGSVASYTANPTQGTAAGVIDTKPLNVGPGGTAGCIFSDFGTRNADPPYLRGPPTSVAINLGGATMPTGLALSYVVETIEQ